MNKFMALICLFCLALTSTATHAQLITETVIFDNFDFFPTGLWSQGPSVGGSGCQWGPTSAKSIAGDAISPLSRDCNPARDILTGPLPLDAHIWLKYGPFDLSGYVDAQVSMRFNAVLEGQHRIWLGHNLSGSCESNPSSPFVGQAFFNGTNGNWGDLSMDIGQRADQANVCVYVVLSTDAVAGGAESVFIDDFHITKQRHPSPEADLKLHSINVTPNAYYPGDPVPVSYSITNTGLTASTAWDVEFWAAGWIGFPTPSDHHLGDDVGTSIAPGATEQFNTVVEVSSSLGPGGWSVRGILNYPDAFQENNVSTHNFSLSNNESTGVMVAQLDAEGEFPNAQWQVFPDSGTGASGCQFGKTTALANASETSLSPVASGCSNPVDVLQGPLPTNSSISMIIGPFDTSSRYASLRWRYWANMGPGDKVLLRQKQADENGCYGDYPSFTRELTMNKTGWANGHTSLETGPALCIVLTFVGDSTSGESERLLLDDFEIIKRNDQLQLALVDAVDGTYMPGDTIDITTIVNNNNFDDFDSYHIRYLLSDRTFITGNAISLGTFGPFSILSQGRDHVVRTLNLPIDMPGGDYFVIAAVDYPDSWKVETNYDRQAISVELLPDIVVAPLNLDVRLVDGSAAQAVEENTAAAVAVAVAVYDIESSPASKLRKKNVSALVEKAQSKGKVNVIVELLNRDAAAIPFANKSQRQARQSAIQDSGNNLLQSMQGLSVKTNYQYRHIPFMAITVDAAAIDFLANSPAIGSITEDGLSTPNMESSNAVIGSAQAWAAGYNGTGQTIAVLDTGFDTSHSWFGDGAVKVVAEACFSSASAGSHSLCPDDVSPSTGVGSASVCDAPSQACRHGTHVAGTAVGNDGNGPGFGVARGADIVAIQVFSYVDGQGHRAKWSDQIAALEHVLELSESMDIAAVNMSLGGDKYTNPESCDLAHAARKSVIDNLRSVGVATVISSGNDSYRDGIGEPGCISSAISVGATTDLDELADFSNVSEYIHLLAPGVDIVSALPGEQFASLNGTSMAAPHVAGAFAVLKQRHPSASVGELLGLLQFTGTRLDDLRSFGEVTDMRRINLDLALEASIGEANAKFVIRNTVDFSVLNISAIDFDQPAPWLSLDPPPPYVLADQEFQEIQILIDKDLAPQGHTQVRLLIQSDDLDESIYPGGVYLNFSRLGEEIFIGGFEGD